MKHKYFEISYRSCQHEAMNYLADDHFLGLLKKKFSGYFDWAIRIRLKYQAARTEACFSVTDPRNAAYSSLLPCLRDGMHFRATAPRGPHPF